MGENEGRGRKKPFTSLYLWHVRSLKVAAIICLEAPWLDIRHHLLGLLRTKCFQAASGLLCRGGESQSLDAYPSRTPPLCCHHSVRQFGSWFGPSGLAITHLLESILPVLTGSVVLQKQAIKNNKNLSEGIYESQAWMHLTRGAMGYFYCNVKTSSVCSLISWCLDGVSVRLCEWRGKCYSTIMSVRF